MKLSGIRFRLLLLGIIPAFILTSALAYYFIDNQIRKLEISLNERGDIITRQLAFAGVYGVFSGNNLILQELVNPVLQENDVVSVQIFNDQDEILAEAQLLTFPDPEYLLTFTAPVVLQPIDNADKNDETLFYPGVVKPSYKKIGTVRIRLSLENTLANQRIVLFNSLLITFSGVLITALLAFRLGHNISLPIIKLTQAVNDISLGNLSTRANFNAEYEIEDLREGFNVMAIGLEQTHQYLEKRVEKATSKLIKANIELERKNRSLEKSKQLAIAQNEIKSQFLAHISHEIRTPMNGIIGFTDLLLNSNKNPEQIDRLELIRSSATNLLSIVNEILELSSLESGKFSLNFVLFNIRICLENTVSLFSKNIKKVELILDIDSNIPQQINNDPIRLQQIVTNLLSNANKFTQQGNIIVRCRLLDANSDHQSIFISVSDTGMGISKANQTRLFSPFLQLSQFAIDQEQGTGLGLSITKNIVERMQGKIGVFSSENCGSTFWVNLPCNTNQTNTIPSQGCRIAIIIANTIRRRAFKKQLINLGHQVSDYADTAAFLETDAENLDLAFIDAKLSIAQNSIVSSKSQFNFIKNQKPRMIILFRHYENKTLPSGAIALDLPCRSDYLSTLIKLNLNSDFEPINQVDKQPAPIKKSLGNSAILIADDNEINRLLLKSQFEDQYQYVDMAKDGREALDYILTTTYDLILLDLQMPGLSGMVLIKKIKTPQCRNSNTPVIAITAHAQNDQRQKVIDAGFDDCLIKPILPEHFAKVIDNCIQSPSLTVVAAQQQAPDYMQAMLAKTMNNKDLAQTLFDKLFQELPEQIQVIKSACTKLDFSLAQATTHKLHGSAGFCGLSEIQNAARDLEISLTDRNTNKISLHLEHLENTITRFMANKNTIIEKFHV